MVKEIKRDYYLEQLIKREGNGLIKIVTGIKRCGKSYLLRTLFKNHLLENGVDDKHIIEMAFDLFDNIESVSYTHLDVYKRQDKNLRMLMKYAAMFHVENILRPYLEVLL